MTKNNEAVKEKASVGVVLERFVMPAFERWLREQCFQKPTQEAYDLARAAWLKATDLAGGVNSY